MPVEKDINLDKPLTDEEIRALEEEANHLEELAEGAHEDAKKAKEFQKEEESMLNDAIKKIEQLEKEAEKAEKAKNKIGRSIKEVNQLATHRSGLGGMGGEDPFAEGEQFGMGGMIPGAGQIQTGRTGFGTGQERSATGNMATTIKKLEMALKEAEKKRKEAEKKATKERMANAKKIAEQRAMVGKITKGQSDFFAMQRNPMGFAGGRLTGMLAKGGIYGIIAIAVMSMASQMFEEVKKLYGPGGPFDVRKEMLDRDREMIEMNQLIDRRAGRVFFTSDTSLIQGPPEINAGNTDQTVNRTLRFQALHLGE